MKRLAHIQDNSCAQGLPSMLTRSTFAKVNCEVADIASFRLSKHPYLDPPFNWLFRHVLPEKHPAFIFHHSLIMQCSPCLECTVPETCAGTCQVLA